MKLSLIVAAAVLAATPALAQDVANGEKVFRKCVACHAVGPDAKNKIGPILNGVVGAPVGHREDYKYSKALLDKKPELQTWTDENMAAWLKAPKAVIPGTKMAFAGLKVDQEIADVIAYLKTFQ
jgi:cytochrome c